MLWIGYHNTECDGNNIFFTKYTHNTFDLVDKKPFLNFSTYFSQISQMNGYMIFL